MESLNNINNILLELIEDYTSKIIVPNWFSLNQKTLLSKDITLEDWNTLQWYLKYTISENEAVFKYCQELGTVLNTTFVTDLNNKLNTKLDKITTYSTDTLAYVKFSTGENGAMPVQSEDGEASSLVKRGANGHIKSNSPNANDDVANKLYVDALESRFEGKLQELKDNIDARSDVVDIVDTPQDLLNYNSSTLTDGDIVKVLNDGVEGYTGYYRWNIQSNEFDFIGSQGPFVTVAGMNQHLTDLQQEIPNHIKSDSKTNTLYLSRNEKDLETSYSKTSFNTINGETIFGNSNLSTAYTHICQSTYSIPLSEYLKILNAEIVVYAGNSYFRSFVELDNSKVEFTRIIEENNNVFIVKLGFTRPIEGESSLIEQPSFNLSVPTTDNVQSLIEDYIVANYENGDLGEY